MQLKFPLPDVKIEISDTKKEVKEPLYDDGFYRLNQNEFSMEVEEVGHFYASGGDYISLVIYPVATQATVELYLNGSTYGAILHQRKIMPLHGSCFVYKSKGIMICGESGAGKSSLTAAFCHKGGRFLTDDVSPVDFKESLPFILPLSDRIKLWEDSLEQLQLKNRDLTQIWEEYSKFYFPMDTDQKAPFPLHQVFIVEKHKDTGVRFQDLKGVERFTALRNEIYRWEYLEGMPESEKQYVNHLIQISEQVHVVKVFRPEEIQIEKLRTILAKVISHPEV